MLIDADKLEIAIRDYFKNRVDNKKSDEEIDLILEHNSDIHKIIDSQQTVEVTYRECD